MKYSYTETGLTADQDGTKTAIVDTESLEYGHRIAWICGQSGLKPPIESYMRVQSPGDPTPNINGALTWTGNSAESIAYTTDVYLTYLSPEAALIELRNHFNLAIPSIHKYEPPKPPAPPEDWTAPGSPVGRPHPSYPGFFTGAVGSGLRDGHIWTAPSGNRYQLVAVGEGMFAYRMWKKL